MGAQRVHGTKNGCFGAGNVISGGCGDCCCGGGCAAHGPLNTNVHTSSLGLSVQEGVAVMVRHHGLLLLGHIPHIQSSRIKASEYLEGGKNHSCMTHQSEKYFQNLTPSLWPVLKQKPKLYQKKKERKKLKHFFIY